MTSRFMARAPGEESDGAANVYRVTGGVASANKPLTALLLAIVYLH